MCASMTLVLVFPFVSESELNSRRAHGCGFDSLVVRGLPFGLLLIRMTSACRLVIAVLVGCTYMMFTKSLSMRAHWTNEHCLCTLVPIQMRTFHALSWRVALKASRRLTRQPQCEEKQVGGVPTSSHGSPDPGRIYLFPSLCRWKQNPLVQ